MNPNINPMKTANDNEKSEYSHFSKEELGGIIDFIKEEHAVMEAKYYEMCRKIELYEIETTGLVTYLDRFQEVLLNDNRGKLDIKELIRLQKSLINEIRTHGVMRQPKDSNPLKELIKEYCRQRTWMSN